jgi:xylan 1,4-beta-xylosidase
MIDKTCTKFCRVTGLIGILFLCIWDAASATSLADLNPVPYSHGRSHKKVLGYLKSRHRSIISKQKVSNGLSLRNLPGKKSKVVQPALIADRTIEIDVNHNQGLLDRSFLICVGAGRANEGLRADWQRQLNIVKKECGFQYIRFHGLLTDDMGVYKEDKNGTPIYNWQYIDELYDYLLSIKMKPFVEFGFMPEALASGQKTIFWWKGNITPPKDYDKWADLIKQLLVHWTERYGSEELRTWYFEVWNEPNLHNIFFSGDQAEYFKFYEHTAFAVKSVDSQYRVGGPATAGNAWIPQTIEYCFDKKIPIDFISTHDYGVKQGFLDATGDVGTIINPNKNAVANDMKRSRLQITNSKMPQLELNYTEWSSSYTPTDAIHDTYEEAPYILNTVKHAARYVNSMSYWTFTDIFEEQGPRMTPFHGGFGLMNYQDIKKPAYFAYQYLNELGKFELATNDSSALVFKDGKGNIQALFWDCTIDHPGDSTNDQQFYKRDLPSKAAGNVSVSLRGLKPGKYRLLTYKVGYRVNDAYSTYLDMRSPSQLTKKQVDEIKRKNSGTPTSVSDEVINANGEFKKTYNMRQNDVFFLKLIRV